MPEMACRFKSGLRYHFSALHTWLHKLWRHELHLIATCNKLAAPVMGSGTSLYANLCSLGHTPLQFSEPIVTRQTLLPDHMLSGTHAVNLLHVFRQIYANSTNLHRGFLLLAGDCWTAHSVWHLMPKVGYAGKAIDRGLHQSG